MTREALYKACVAEYVKIRKCVARGTLKSHKNWESLEDQYRVIVNTAYEVNETGETCPIETWETFLEMLKKFNEQYFN